MPFKMHKKNSGKKMYLKQNMCLPFLNFQTCYPKHTYFFIWPNCNFLQNFFCMQKQCVSISVFDETGYFLLYGTMLGVKGRTIVN